MGILGYAILMAFADENPAVRLITLSPYALLVGLVLVLRFGGSGWLVAWTIHKNNPALRSVVKHSISEDGYRIHWGHGETFVEWSGILRLVETREFFLTFPTKSGAYFLPKRVIDEAQVRSLRTLAREKAADRFVQLVS